MASLVVIENDDAFLAVVLRELKAAGHQVVGFADWVGVLELLDTGYRVEAFVVDLRLTPGTPNGHSLGQMAGVKRPGLKVLYMTADAVLAHTMRRTLRNVLVKSGDPGAVAAAIEYLLAA